MDSGTLQAPISASDVSQENLNVPVAVYEPLVNDITQVLTFKILPPPDTPPGAQSITRLSAAGTGAEGNNYSESAVVSDSARYVAFASYASNLVPRDTNNIEDIFLRDTCTGATGCTPSIARVSLFTDGSELTSPFVGSREPAISGNGRVIAYVRTTTSVSPQRSDIVVFDSCIGVSNCTPSLRAAG